MLKTDFYQCINIGKNGSEKMEKEPMTGKKHTKIQLY